MSRLRGLPTWQLFAMAVAIWSTTWHAILYQLAHQPPEAGVALRFALAGALVLAVCAGRGEGIAFGLRAHGRLALQGGFMYGLAYLCVYHAELHVPTGLVAVGYSAAPLCSGVGAWLLWRSPLGMRFLVGGLLCVAGVLLIFWPELAQMSRGSEAGRGALFTVAAVALSTLGGLVASRNAVHRLPFWPSLGWGMLYGAALAAAVALLQGQSLLPPSPFAAASWWLSLAYLSLAGSIVAFACFLTLQQRIGPGPASAVGVMTPVLALLMSAWFEGFVPQALTWLGIALAAAGNVLILRPRARAVPP